MIARWALPLVLCGVVGVAVADPPSGSKEDGHHSHFGMHDSAFGRLISYNIGRLMMLKSEMNVTPAQHAKVMESLKSHKAEIGTVIKDLVTKRRELREAVRNDSPDEAAIRKAADELGHSIGNAAVLASKIRGELKPDFTDKQIELFQKFITDHDASVDRWLKEEFGE